MKTLFLSWQDPTSRAWFPIGKLTHDGHLYHFVYLQGAIAANEKADFQPIISFPDFHQTYGSLELFPLFHNRLLRPSRPDYSDFIQWLNLPIGEKDPISILSRSGGRRQTDSFEVFPALECTQSGQYKIHFFVHGLSYFPASDQERVLALEPNEQLFIMHDCQNTYDSRALMLRTDDRYNVGFCPRYLAQDFFELVDQFPQKVQVTVERLNPVPTPLQFRLLCQLTADWGEDFHPFSSVAYTPLVEIKTSAIV